MKRALGDESGFTLPEMLVTILVMLTVLFALYSIFDTSLRVFSFGNDKVEAVENARLGMARMEREIRAAYPQDKAGEDETLLTVWEPGRISFGNDLNSNRRIDTADPDIPEEQFTYDLYQPSGSDAPALGKSEGSSNRQSVVEFVEPGGLEFEYLDDAGNAVSPGSGQESDIQRVRITLRVEVDRGPQAGTQELTTDVALRNRGN